MNTKEKFAHYSKMIIDAMQDGWVLEFYNDDQTRSVYRFKDNHFNLIEKDGESRYNPFISSQPQYMIQTLIKESGDSDSVRAVKEDETYDIVNNNLRINYDLSLIMRGDKFTVNHKGEFVCSYEYINGNITKTFVESATITGFSKNQIIDEKQIQVDQLIEELREFYSEKDVQYQVDYNQSCSDYSCYGKPMY